LGSLDADVDITELVKLIKRISKYPQKILGYYELKKHKPWFDEGCSKLLDQRKQAKLQWLQESSEIKADNLNSVSQVDSGHGNI
jgi:hypothetical protein